MKLLSSAYACECHCVITKFSLRTGIKVKTMADKFTRITPRDVKCISNVTGKVGVTYVVGTEPVVQNRS